MVPGCCRLLLEVSPIYPDGLVVPVGGLQGLGLNIKFLDGNIEQQSNPDFNREVHNKSKPLIL
jgi:hypothetical protein